MTASGRQTASFSRRALSLAAGICFVSLVGSGCGHDSGPQRFPVHGRVSRAGAELSEGSISFLPADGNEGPAASTGIVDGEYRFTTQDGPVAGPHRVVVRLPMQKNRMVFPEAKQGSSQGRMSWDFERTVEQEGPNEMDFEVEQQP